MKKLEVSYNKNGKKVSGMLSVQEVKKLLKDVVKIQISTRRESIEIKDSIDSFIKNYKKYGVKNLSKKYKTSEPIIKDKLLSLGVSG